jgi:hypothetical protein
MFRLPVEIWLAVLSYLNFYQLLRAREVCRQWQQIILDSYLWPCSVVGALEFRYKAPCIDKSSGRVFEKYLPTAQWHISWRDWVVKEEEEEYFEHDPQATCQLLHLFSKGRTKSLCVDFPIVLPDILDVLHNFLSLQNLSIHMESVSSHELTSILQCLPQITTFELRICKFQGTPKGRLGTIQLNLSRLTISISRRSRAIMLHNTLANIVHHSPDLVCLSVGGANARKMWTTKLGDRVKHLSLYIERTLPPISCRGLKYLVLKGSRDQSREPFEPCPCDLSYLTHLSINAFSTEQQLSLMEAYNIGANLEEMHMDSNPGNAALERTPRLKSLGLPRVSIDMPLHFCPELRTIYTSLSNESIQLQSQGYTVHSSYMANMFHCDVCQDDDYY